MITKSPIHNKTNIIEEDPDEKNIITVPKSKIKSKNNDNNEAITTIHIIIELPIHNKTNNFEEDLPKTLNPLSLQNLKTKI